MGACTSAMLDDLASWECKHEGISMKSILLTSTALVAFAGAAAADGHATPGISFTGEATLGYNTTDGINEPAADGFYWDASIDVTMEAALDNGLVATATFGYSVADNNLGDAVTSGDYVLTLAGGDSSLSFGDLDPVAEDRFGDVSGGTTAGFNDQDAHFGGVGFDAMLVGETTFAGFTGAISFGVDSGDGLNVADVEDVDAMQIHIAGTVSIVDLELAYQGELAGADAVLGVAAGVSVAGADLTVSYVDDGTENSTGFSVAYPVGPVTVSAYYSLNDINEDNYGVDLDYAANGFAVNVFADVDGGENGADDVTEYGIEGSYDVGNGLVVYAGFLASDVDDSPETVYAAAEYDLGGGASLLFSYADDGVETAVGEDLGDPEYMEGITIEASFSF